MAQWIGSKRIVFIPMIRPSDPPNQDEAYISDRLLRLVGNPRDHRRLTNQLTFRQMVTRLSHGRAKLEFELLPAIRVPWTDLWYGPTTPKKSDKGVDFALDHARWRVGGNPGVDYVVCSFGQGNDPIEGTPYLGVAGVGGTSRPSRGWIRLHDLAPVGQFLHETIHVVGNIWDYYIHSPELINLDPMSDGSAHFTAYTKRLLGWLPPENIAPHITGTKIYTLRHQAIFDGTNSLGFAAVAIATQHGTYYVESRQPVDQFEATLPPEDRGVVVYQVAQDDDGSTSEIDPKIYRRTPLALTAGQEMMFEDNKLRLRVLSIEAQSAQIEISYNITPAGNICSSLQAQIEQIEQEIEILMNKSPVDQAGIDLRTRQILRLEARMEANGCG